VPARRTAPVLSQLLQQLLRVFAGTGDNLKSFTFLVAMYWAPQAARGSDLHRVLEVGQRERRGVAQVLGVGRATPTNPVRSVRNSRACCAPLDGRARWKKFATVCQATNAIRGRRSRSSRSAAVASACGARSSATSE